MSVKQERQLNLSCTLARWFSTAMLLGLSLSQFAACEEVLSSNLSGQDMVNQEPSADPHAHHRQMMNQPDYKRSMHNYSLPNVFLIGQDGVPVEFVPQLDATRTVMLDFIFTTCTTICPILSATFSQVRRELGAETEQIQMISITIDPEYDTPERLLDYSERYKADAGWQFLTGSTQDIVSVQKAFDAYRGSKANHVPLTFIRMPDADSWLRLEGLASASDVIDEYHGLAAE